MRWSSRQPWHGRRRDRAHFAADLGLLTVAGFMLSLGPGWLSS